MQLNQQRTKIGRRLTLALFAAGLAVLTLAVNAAAQSTDAENPTPMTSNVVTGKSNGKAKTIYYSFMATAVEPGEVKVKVTASTDERSTSLRVNFLEDSTLVQKKHRS